jgi:hypothetical protein
MLAKAIVKRPEPLVKIPGVCNRALQQKDPGTGGVGSGIVIDVLDVDLVLGPGYGIGSGLTSRYEGVT